MRNNFSKILISAVIVSAVFLVSNVSALAYFSDAAADSHAMASNAKTLMPCCEDQRDIVQSKVIDSLQYKQIKFIGEPVELKEIFPVLTGQPINNSYSDLAPPGEKLSSVIKIE